jgi:ATP-dependent exoDNAse (exonuclease V) alpha subunit
MKKPVRHLSLRVPWHDNNWCGSVCNFPKLNSACQKLVRISEEKDDEAETVVAGKLIKDLSKSGIPCCVAERATFMAPFEFERVIEHPYVKTSPKTHGHYQPTKVTHPPYSAAGVPFAWMREQDLEHYAETYAIHVNRDWEPELGFDTGWVQDIRNQRALLDCFFEHIVPEESLCFFYAKQVPFVEDFGRVLIGVGRVKKLGEGLEYICDQSSPFRSMIWDRMIMHSIRPDFSDGFLLPYKEILELSKKDLSLNPAEFVAFASADRIPEFSYATEHVTNDAAIASLLACAESFRKVKRVLDGPWDKALGWIDARINELWKMRGAFPGLGAALSAFGIELGGFIAREIEERAGESENPWAWVDQAFVDPKKVLSLDLAPKVGRTLQEVWKQLPKERRTLLQLISRFELSPDQAKLLYVGEERANAGIQITDAQIIKNPYLLYEITRHTESPISLETIDKGAFAQETVRKKFPLPDPSALENGVDQRRVRAFAVSVLDAAAEKGHTLLPTDQVILDIRSLLVQPPCEVTRDIMNVAKRSFVGAIAEASMADNSPAMQLEDLSQMGQLIRNEINKRTGGKRHAIAVDWRQLLDKRLGPLGTDEEEKRARDEKTAALKELAESRFSVLIGPAGTGKTTLLSVLCSQKEIAEGEVLLLAPTGKARVRMEQATKGLKLKGYTIAQYLSDCGRYDGRLQRYMISAEPAKDAAKTVIVDEASMLTEEMLGALIDSLKGAQRLILVGDPRQLPPIGAGRPFVDIVTALSPQNIELIFPKVGKGYAELTVRRRQLASKSGIRRDIQLAEWFSGRQLGPAEDEIFDTIVRESEIENLRFVEWNTAEEVRELIIDIIVKELGLKGRDDIQGFDITLGGKPSNGYTYFNVGSADKAEAWQILSPVHAMSHGVTEMNRQIHRVFRSKMVEFAQRPYYLRKIPVPMGGQQIVYGDKVINVLNHHRRGVYPDENASKYIANGEIGISVGQFKSAKMKKPPWALKVEFSSQPGFQYDFLKKDFGEERDTTIELAYVLTVHKAQGSEFGLVIVVLPNPCWVLSRELLYTALTRQRDRVVILHQGARIDLKKYASSKHSDTAKRLTNLFSNPKPVKVEDTFLEDRLINCTSDGTLVRSKSEVIIYDRLKAKGLKPSYERPLTLGGVTKWPDFTIVDDASGITFYWEHLGMLGDPGYRRRWEAKLNWYRENKILPLADGGGEKGTLITTQDSADGGISSLEIDKLIDSSLT